MQMPHKYYETLLGSVLLFLKAVELGDISDLLSIIVALLAITHYLVRFADRKSSRNEKSNRVN